MLDNNGFRKAFLRLKQLKPDHFQSVFTICYEIDIPQFHLEKNFK